MAQNSKFWTTGSTGDGLNKITMDEWGTMFRYLFNTDPTIMGVLPRILNELAVTGTSSPLSVNTGASMVYGFMYWNDAAVALAVATPGVGTTGGHVILRADWAAQTVRLVAVRNTAGVAAIPSLVQVAGTTWEIRLASFTITTGGVIAVTDVREFARFSTALVVRRQGGSATDWDTPGTTNYRPHDSAMQVGTYQETPSADLGGTISITFPSVFAAPPFVILNYKSVVIEAYVDDGSETTTGFDIVWRTPDITPTSIPFTISWLAIGPVSQ